MIIAAELIFLPDKRESTMKDWKRFEQRMGRAAEAGTRYLSSVEKAMRRMSDKSSIESRNALSDAKREAETSLSLIEDALFAEAGIQECIGLCDSYQCLLMDAVGDAPDEGEIRGNLEESIYQAELSMDMLKAAVDGYRSFEEEDGVL